MICFVVIDVIYIVILKRIDHRNIKIDTREPSTTADSAANVSMANVLGGCEDGGCVRVRVMAWV